MSTGLKILWNCASILTGNFLNKVISIFLLMYLTKYFSPAEFGRYSFVISYIAFFGIFTDLGINTLMTREISGSAFDAEEGFGIAILLRLLLSIITMCVSLVSLVIIGYSSDIILLAAAASISLFLSFRGLFFRTVFDIPFQVNLKMSYPAAINFLNEVLTLGLAIFLIRGGVSLFGLVLAINIANVPGFIAIVYFSMRLIKPRFIIDAKAWKKVLRESLPLGGAALLEGVFIIIPVFLLSRLATDEALGFFALPFRLTASLWIIPVAVMVSLLPRMSRDAVSSEALVKEGFLRGLKILLLIGLPIAFVTDMYSDTFITVFTGAGYLESAPALSVMIWATVIYFINTSFYYTFTAAGQQKLNAVVWAVNSILSILLSAMLIPEMKAAGAAIAFTASLGAGLMLNIILAYLCLRINVFPVLAKFSLCGLAAAVFFWIIPSHHNLAFISGMGAYAAMILSLKAVSLREWGEWLNRAPQRTINEGLNTIDGK